MLTIDFVLQALPEDQLRDIYQQAAGADQALRTPQQLQRDQGSDAWEGQQVDGVERLVVRSSTGPVFANGLACSWQAAACRLIQSQVC